MVLKNKFKTDLVYSIAIRIGAEIGEKKLGYSVHIDKNHVASEAINATKGKTSDALFWNIKTFKFDITSEEPSKLILKQDKKPTKSELDNTGGLIFDWININGEEVTAGSSCISASDGWKSWFDSSGEIRETWIGDLIIDLRAIRAETHLIQKPKIKFPITFQSTRLLLNRSVVSGSKETLSLKCTYVDLQNPKFVAELRLLQKHLLEFGGTKNKSTYERLGLEIGAWKNLSVTDERGHPINVDPLAKSVAPVSGTEIASLDRSLPISSVYHNSLLYEKNRFIFSYLPPGALLNRGVNMGNGRWLLNLNETTDLLLTPPRFATSKFVFNVKEVAFNKKTKEMLYREIGYCVSKEMIYECLPKVSPTDPLEIFYMLKEAQSSFVGFSNITCTISEMPAGALLSAGENHGSGFWVIEDQNLASLKLLPPTSIKYPFTVVLRVWAGNPKSGIKKMIEKIIKCYPDSVEFAS